MSILDEGKDPEQLRRDANEQRERDYQEAVTAMWSISTCTANAPTVSP